MRHYERLTAVFLLGATLAACDFTTSEPDFVITPEISAPLIFDKTFVLVGPGDTGFEALIDRNDAAFDSVLSVDPASDALYLETTLDAFGFQDIASNLPAVSVERQEIAVPREITQTSIDWSVTVGTAPLRFDSDDDYVQFSGGFLQVDIRNEFNTAFDIVRIESADILNEPYGTGSEFGIEFSDVGEFGAIGPGESRDGIVIPLDRVRFQPTGGILRLRLEATADRPPDQLQPDRSLVIGIGIVEAQTSAIQAYTDAFRVDATPDVNQDGFLDLDDPAESIQLEVPGLQDLSDAGLDGFSLAGGIWTLELSTNANADFELYTALVGVTGSEQRVWLRGLAAPYRVDAAVPEAQGFRYGGQPVAPSDLLRLPLDSGCNPSCTLQLTAATASVDEFLSELPTEIKIASRGLFQPSGGRVSIPPDFSVESTVSTRIPIRLTTDFVFSDSVDADLSDLADLADPEQDVGLDHANITLAYENGVPLGVDIVIRFLDESGTEVFRLPRSSDPPLRLDPAPADPSGLSIGVSSGETLAGLERGDVDLLSRSRRAVIELSLLVDETTTAALRATDTIRLSAHGDIGLRVRAGSR